MTVEEFERFVNLPENADKLFEFIGGEYINGVLDGGDALPGFRLGVKEIFSE